MRPLEGWVWFRYPNQEPTNARSAGTGDAPSVIAGVLDERTTERRETDYTGRGQITRSTDPLGRTTTYAYVENGLNLLEVRQTTPGGSDRVASSANDTATHRPGPSRMPPARRRPSRTPPPARR
jgi:YD repeat-containing protein